KNYMEKGWVGIDESNHGRYPEIYVAVFSQYPQDASPVIGLKKNRNKGNLDLILKERDFRFILIPKEYKNFLSPNDIAVVNVVEFIKYFTRNKPEYQIKYFIDGEFKQSYLNKIDRVLYPIRTPEIIIESKADVRYPVVNKADYIARLLHNKYNKESDLPKYLFEKIITPRLEDYLEVISESKNEKQKLFRKPYHLINGKR
ncbi:hypothetical protein J4404_03745, partial [Candidatus Woesearchaeota archaeon]|nr:hypothetical protein [Candidatus Woesearchaeota archaeon]